MRRDTTRRLSIDLLTTDLDDPESVTGLLVNNLLRPARALYGMGAPRPGEDDRLTFGNPVEIAEGHRVLMKIEEPLDERVAGFDPFIRGFILFCRLFPQVIEPEGLESSVDTPAEAFFSRSRSIAHLLWADLECLTGGLLHRDGPQRPQNRALKGDYEPDPNDAGLTELHEIQELLRRATTHPGDASWTYQRVDIGLRPMERDVALRLDEIVRTGARQRLIWFADEELGYDQAPDGTYHSISAWVDRGVFPTVVPETISAVFALDFLETLALDRRTGICAHCDRPLLLAPVQVARVGHGKPVYHDDCFEEHRRRYVRAWQQTSYRRKDILP